MSEIERLSALLESQAKALSEAEQSKRGGFAFWRNIARIFSQRAKSERSRAIAAEKERDEWEIKWQRECMHKVAAEARLAEFKAEAKKVIEPFARAGDLFGTCNDDGYDQCIYGPAAGPQYNLMADHLRAARTFLNAEQEKA